MNLMELDEQYNVIEPILKQLESMGWKTMQADELDPSNSFRRGFNDVVLDKELREALMRINPWLEENQVNDIVRAVTFTREKPLPEANEGMFHLFQRNISVAENKKTGERNPFISLIDFKNPDNNSFLAIAQFKVQVPGSGLHIIPDIVLFINGFPLVMIECESSYLADPISSAVQKFKKYSNQSGNKDGNEFLFHYNQFLIATNGQNAKYGTITSEDQDFKEWKDPYPLEITHNENESPHSQQTLIQGMLARQNLLDILRGYIAFKVNENGKLIKIIARYPQFRAVQKMIIRLKTGDTQAHKSGIIYYTHGAGKSVAMVFAARRIFRDPDLQKCKVVIIADKKEIEQLLEKSALSAGYAMRKASNVHYVQEYLKDETPGLILCMMSNYQERELLQEFPVLNESDKIIIMVDEAHRSRYKWMSAHLQKALPNAAKVVYTGTPLEPIQADFNPYIDRYPIKDAVQDGAILDMNYEARIEVADEYAMSAKDKPYKEFKDVIVFTAEDEKKRSLSRRQYLESQEVIHDKASDMLKHYIFHVFPNKLKAQIVTSSHLAAVRYKQELDRVLNDTVNQLNASQNPYIDIDLLKKLKIAAVITKSMQDPPAYRPFTDENEHKKNIASFKLPFGQTQGQITGDVGIIIVTDLLLLGFDAPLVQILYLDQIMKDHYLLQTIARVNRLYPNKHAGTFIDYVGVTTHFKDSLVSFDFKDQDELLNYFKNTKSDIDSLRFSNERIHEFFKNLNISYLEDTDKCLNALSDGKSRNQLRSLFCDFLKYMDRVLPRIDADSYREDLKLLTLVCHFARMRYRDESMEIKEISPKIHAVIDDMLKTRGIDVTAHPAPLFSKQFDTILNASAVSISIATEIEYALRDYFSQHQQEDPELYSRHSETLEKLLTENKERPDLLKNTLTKFYDDVKKGRIGEENFGLDPLIEMPFFTLLMYHIFGVHDYKQITDNQLQLLLELLRKMLPALRKEIQQPNFWTTISAQRKLKTIIMGQLITISMKKEKSLKSTSAIAQAVLELAFQKQSVLLK